MQKEGTALTFLPNTTIELVLLGTRHRCVIVDPYLGIGSGVSDMV
jgi:hypothetical protein